MYSARVAEGEGDEGRGLMQAKTTGVYNTAPLSESLPPRGMMKYRVSVGSVTGSGSGKSRVSETVLWLRGEELKS